MVNRHHAMRRLLPGAAVVRAGRRCFADKAGPVHGARSIPAQFVRGGTSNGLVIEEAALPPYATAGSAAQRLAARAAAWTAVLAPAMGAPDARHGRQLDGMGSGVSSTSKVCVIARTAATDAATTDDDGGSGPGDYDVAFTFVQVGIRDGQLDLAGNCGNMVSAVGPVAFDRGWGGRVVEDGEDGEDGEGGGGSKEAIVRIFNTNTRKTIVSRFPVAGSPPRFCPDGAYAIDGVAGTHARIALSFLQPAGARTGAASGLPTGRAVDALPLPPGSPWGASVRASLVDVSNPGVFVLAASLGLGDVDTGTTTDASSASAAATAATAATDELRRAAAAIEADAGLRATLEHLRRAGAARMGLDPAAQSVPKIVLLFPGRQQHDVRCVALSMGQVHKAAPLTLALCLGAAAHMPGTLAAQLVQAERTERAAEPPASKSSILSIGHPSGSVDVGTTLDPADGTIVSAELHRTARVLMEGRVFY